MKITRRIFNKWTKKQVKMLKEYGLEVEEGYDFLSMDENDTYLELKPYFEKWGIESDDRYAVFSKEEILKADYCIVTGGYDGGYPMPDDGFGYVELTYDTKDYCSHCGIGLVQKDAFRLKKAPKHKIFGLTWVWDELFVQLDIYRNIFEPLGIKCREVKLFKGDKVIPNIVQLVIPNTDETLDLHEYSSQTCPVCGGIRYGIKAQGFHPIQQHPLSHLYRSKEYFGDGAAADRKIFISGELRDILIKEKIMRYYWFEPCKQRSNV